MPRITLDLLRKRSEHNEGEIATLEEIALHQENIEKIELIDKTCRHLKILLLQYNLISKIENLNRLKSLEYLNLALNNIEVIENLEGLECLKKLDLTVNFIGDLRGVKRLRCNERLEQLFLMGNPCADYEGYREYTIATLAQLKELDGKAIERSDRIKALQVYASVEGDVVRGYAAYRKIREDEIQDYRQRMIENERQRAEGNEDEGFWNRPTRHMPEERIALAERQLRQQEERERERNNGRQQPVTRKLKLFSPDGKPYNMNQPKVPFKLDDSKHKDRILLEVGVYRYLDSSQVDVDIQPEYVRVTIKEKVLQLTLPCEIRVDESKAQRNSTNGSLLITMPRLNPLATITRATSEAKTKKRERTTIERRSKTSVREYLEIGPVDPDLDFSRIVRRSGEPPATRTVKRTEEEDCSDVYDDSTDVPPLE